jgi:hypothetical protein
MSAHNNIFVRVLDTVGDGSGTENAIGNYSDAGLGETDFLIKPPTGVLFEVSRILFSIRDGVGASAEKYGSTTALTNGVKILIYRGATLMRDLTNGTPIKTNTHFTRYTHDVMLHEWGAGDEVLSVSWSMHGSDEHIHLDGNRDDKLVIRLNDDMSDLVEQYFSVQGIPRNIT